MGYAKLEDVVAAFVGSICDPDEATNCTAWLIPDDKGVYRMETKGYLCVKAVAAEPISTKTDSYHPPACSVGAEGARRPRESKGAANRAGKLGQGEKPAAKL